jgi:hypothetical protein
VSDEELLRTADLDAYMYIRFFRLCLRLFGGASFFGLVILLPINYTANDSDSSVDTLDRTSMSNIPAESSLVWFHFVFAYGFTAAACYLLWELSVEWLRRRHDWLRGQQLASGGTPSVERESRALSAVGGQMTVLVTGLPKKGRTDSGALREKEKKKDRSKPDSGLARSALLTRVCIVCRAVRLFPSPVR